MNGRYNKPIGKIEYGLNWEPRNYEELNIVFSDFFLRVESGKITKSEMISEIGYISNDIADYYKSEAALGRFKDLFKFVINNSESLLNNNWGNIWRIYKEIRLSIMKFTENRSLERIDSKITKEIKDLFNEIFETEVWTEMLELRELFIKEGYSEEQLLQVENNIREQKSLEIRQFNNKLDKIKEAA